MKGIQRIVPRTAGAKVIVAFAALGVLICIGFECVQPAVVRGASMHPTLHDGERIFIEPFTPWLGALSRGDIVVLAPPASNAERYVKRIIGLPGDVVREESCGLFVNDRCVAGARPEKRPSICIVPEGHYFVLGDNTTHSFDSRMFGPVAASRLQGRVVGQPDYRTLASLASLQENH